MDAKLYTSIISDVDTNKRIVQVLVIVYARELAYRVADAIESASKSKVHCMVCVCDAPMSANILSLSNATYHVAIGTVGRIEVLLNVNSIDGDDLKAFYVMDTGALITPKMKDPFEKIFSHLRRTIKMGIHWPARNEVTTRIESYFTDVHFFREIQHQLLESLHYVMYYSSESERISALCQLCRTFWNNKLLIFFRHQCDANSLTDKMRLIGFRVAIMTKLMTAVERSKAFASFWDGSVPILLLTGYFRGQIDVHKPVTIINYGLPLPDLYSRRINYMPGNEILARNVLFITLAQFTERSAVQELREQLGIPLLHETYAIKKSI